MCLTAALRLVRLVQQEDGTPGMEPQLPLWRRWRRALYHLLARLVLGLARRLPQAQLHTMRAVGHVRFLPHDERGRPLSPASPPLSRASLSLPSASLPGAGRGT